MTNSQILDKFRAEIKKDKVLSDSAESYVTTVLLSVLQDALADDTNMLKGDWDILKTKIDQASMALDVRLNEKRN